MLYIEDVRPSTYREAHKSPMFTGLRDVLLFYLELKEKVCLYAHVFFNCEQQFEAEC